MRRFVNSRCISPMAASRGWETMSGIGRSRAGCSTKWRPIPRATKWSAAFARRHGRVPAEPVAARASSFHSRAASVRARCRRAVPGRLPCGGPCRATSPGCHAECRDSAIWSFKQNQPMFEVSSTRVELRQAEGFFRKALDASPDPIEARSPPRPRAGASRATRGGGDRVAPGRLGRPGSAAALLRRAIPRRRSRVARRPRSGARVSHTTGRRRSTRTRSRRTWPSAKWQSETAIVTPRGRPSTTCWRFPVQSAE